MLIAAGSAQKLFSRTSPFTPNDPAMAPTQTRSLPLIGTTAE